MEIVRIFSNPPTGFDMQNRMKKICRTGFARVTEIKDQVWMRNRTYPQESTKKPPKRVAISLGGFSEEFSNLYKHDFFTVQRQS